MKTHGFQSVLWSSVRSRQPCARPSVLSKVAKLIGVFFEAHVPEKYEDFIVYEKRWVFHLFLFSILCHSATPSVLLNCLIVRSTIYRILRQQNISNRVAIYRVAERNISRDEVAYFVILSGAKQSKNCFAQSNISIRKCDLVVDRIGISFKSVEVKRQSNCCLPANRDPASPNGSLRMTVATN